MAGKKKLDAEVAIRGDARGLQKTLRGARAGFKSAMAGIRKSALGVGKILGTGGLVFGAAAVAGSVRAIKAYAKQGDELAKLKKQLGFGVEAQQELEFAAGRSGVANGQLTKGIEQLSKRIGELQTTTAGGTLGTFLKDAPKEFSDLLKGAESTEQAFNIVQRAIAEAPKATTKAAIANAAFGRSGLKLVRFLQLESEEIERLRALQRGFGNITGDNAKDAEDFTDALADVTAAGLGLRNAIGGEILPDLTALARELTVWVGANKDLIAQDAVTLYKNIGKALSETDWKAIGSAIQAVGTSVAWLGKNLSVDLVAAFAVANAALKGNPLIFTLTTVAAAAASIASSIDKIGGTSTSGGPTTQSIASRGYTLDAAIDAASGGVGGLGIASAALNRRSGATPSEFRSIEAGRSAAAAHRARLKSLRRGFPEQGSTQHGEITIKVQAEAGTSARASAVKERTPGQSINVVNDGRRSLVGAP